MPHLEAKPTPHSPPRQHSISTLGLTRDREVLSAPEGANEAKARAGTDRRLVQTIVGVLCLPWVFERILRAVPGSTPDSARQTAPPRTSAPSAPQVAPPVVVGRGREGSAATYTADDLVKRGRSSILGLWQRSNVEPNASCAARHHTAARSGARLPLATHMARRNAFNDSDQEPVPSVP